MSSPLEKKIVQKATSGDEAFDAAIDKFFPKGKVKAPKKTKILPFFDKLDLKITRLEIPK